MSDHQTKTRQCLAYVLTVVCSIALATGVGWVFRLLGFPETNNVVVYILSVLLAARFTKGYIYGIVASVLAMAAFNYFFTTPYYTFSVNDPSYVITFVIMTLTAIVTGALTSKVKQTALVAKQNEEETMALFKLTNRLTDAPDMASIAGISVGTVSAILNCQAACLCFRKDGYPESSFIQQLRNGTLVHRNVDSAAALKRRIEGLRSSYEIGPEFYDWPIYGRDAILGILRIPVETAQRMTVAQTRLLHSIIESTALAMDRFRSAAARAESNEETVRQRDRGNLLRAISHDLRTPLSGIMGTAEMLMSMTSKEDERYQLAYGIRKDADWLHSLVENILNLTRLQEGRLVITKQKEAVEEIVSVAVAAVTKRTADRTVSVEIPDEVLMVPMDARLIEQLLVNLLDNAFAQTLQGQEVGIRVRTDRLASCAEFTIFDRGSGIKDEDLPHLFEMFYSAHSLRPDARRGVGLGLTICKTIVTAHGGTILARNRSDGPGAEFIFTLPLEEENHADRE